VLGDAYCVGMSRRPSLAQNFGGGCSYAWQTNVITGRQHLGRRLMADYWRMRMQCVVHRGASVMSEKETRWTWRGMPSVIGRPRPDLDAELVPERPSPVINGRSGSRSHLARALSSPICQSQPHSFRDAPPKPASRFVTSPRPSSSPSGCLAAHPHHLQMCCMAARLECSDDREQWGIPRWETESPPMQPSMTASSSLIGFLKPTSLRRLRTHLHGHAMRGRPELGRPWI
jgi:hypothetical protein